MAVHKPLAGAGILVLTAQRAAQMFLWWFQLTTPCSVPGTSHWGSLDTAPWGSLGTVTWGSPLQSSIQRNGPTCLQTPASVQTAQPHSNSKSSWWPWPWGHQEGQFPGENIANTMSHCSNSPMVHQVCIPLWRQRESLSLALWSE